VHAIKRRNYNFYFIDSVAVVSGAVVKRTAVRFGAYILVEAVTMKQIHPVFRERRICPDY
jgi:hypothetical protein